MVQLWRFKLEDEIKKADIDALMEILGDYCNLQSAHQNGNLTNLILKKLRRRGVMQQLVNHPDYERLADGGVPLMKLFCYGFMSDEEIDDDFSTITW